MDYKKFLYEQEASFERGLGVEFEVVGGGRPAGGGALSAAANILLESMARGVVLAEDAGAIGAVGFGSTLQPAATPLPSVLRAGEGSGVVVVPDGAAADAVDIAALGDLALLMDVQLLACRDIDQALKLLAADRDMKREVAVGRFAEISVAAQRTPVDSLVRNPLVKSRLNQVVELCPEHLSAAALLAAGRPNAAPASFQASARRLSEIESTARSWVAGYLADPDQQPVSSPVEDAQCAGALAQLRTMRPRLHPEARSYADGISDLIEDLRDAIDRGGAITERRAVALQRSLESLSVKVATLGLAEPE